jgi:hypothetical protein
MLPNEVFALTCRAYYNEIGITVDEKNGEFAHCPYPEGMGETGYYLLHDHHQQQGILQSKDVDKCCFFIGYARQWLLECDPFPDNYFDLWDIYETYSRKHGERIGKEGNQVAHSKRNEEGKSILGIENGKRLNAKKNKEGKSVNALKGNMTQRERGVGIYSLSSEELSIITKKVHEEKTEEGNSSHAVRSGKAAHREKDDRGKSKLAVRSAKHMNSQVWESTIDGYRGNAGHVAKHNKKRGWDPNARVKLE